MTPFAWFSTFLKKQRLKFVLGMFLMLVVSGMTVINPKLQGIIVDRVILGGAYRLLMPCVVAMLATIVVRMGVFYGARLLFEQCSQGVLYDMRDAVYRKLLKEDFAFYNINRTGDLMSRQTGDMDAVRHFVSFVIWNLFRNALVLGIALVMIFFVDVRLALLLVGVLPFSALVVFLQMRAVGPAFDRIRQCFSSLNSFVQENIAANRVVRAFAKEPFEIARFNKENEAYRQSELGAAAVWQRYVPVFEFFASVINVILMLYGGFLVIRGRLTLGALVTVNGYLWMLTDPLRQIGWLINDAMRFRASIKKIYATYSVEPLVSQPAHPVRASVAGDVEFRGVRYRAGGEQILHDVSFVAPRGTSVGIIGGTGSGKTTVMNLLCRFYDVTEGAVLVDGIDVRQRDLHDLRDGIGMAMQDVFLFSDTIEGNIAYGDSSCPFARVEQAARLADADGFIRALPDGYDTIVGERGVGLSGGQRQRISLARALLKDPAIIILDDSTSAVDMETETQIQRSLKTAAAGRTLFIIAYRISSVKDCDQILVMQDGTIAERGTHAELVARDGYYASVYRHQYGEFDDDATSRGARTPVTGEDYGTQQI